MDLVKLKEKLRSISARKAPLELLTKIKGLFVSFCSNVFSLVKGLFGRFSGHSVEASRDEPSPLAGTLRRASAGERRFPSGKKKLILFGLGGAVVLIFGLLITIIVVNSRPKRTGVSNVAAGLTIPAEEFFFPPEPDFLPDFLPERERRYFWTLSDIRQYWKAPGNSGRWMDEIKSTVDSIMEGVP